MKERELIAECIKGKNSARKMLYERYSQQMMGLCFRYTGNKEIAEDLLHEGFIKIFMSINSFEYRGDGSLMAWIQRIFSNLCCEYLRKNENRFKQIDIDGFEIAEETIDQETYPAISEDQLLLFISELPINYRTVFNLYVFDNLTHKEIAQQTGISDVNSRSRFLRARALLMNKINEYVKKNE